MTSPIFILPELLNPILDGVRNEIKTLYACMLINRTWCRAAAPILWRAPFSNRWMANRSLITTFIRCLDDVSKDKLMVLFQRFPSEALKTPTFDYTSFLHELQYPVLFDTVKSWCKEQDLNFCQNDEDMFLNPTSVTTVILEMLVEQFMEKSKNLSKLSIPIVTHRNGEYVCLSKHNAAARKCLPNIRYFDCDDCIPENLIFASEFCTNLSRLDIDCSWGNDDVVSAFLKAQNCLRHITVTKRWPYVTDIKNLRRSLKCIVFKDNKNYVDNGGPLSVLSTCEELEIMRFDKWLSLPENVMNDLASSSFPRLRKLSFTRCKPTADVVRTMILMNGFNLEELTLSWENQNNLSVCDELSVITAIAENCPKLKYLDVPIERNDLGDFYDLLRSCKRLQSLTINVHPKKEECYYTPYNVDHFLPIMGTIMPKHLYQLNIFAPWKFKAESLREFLENNCQNQFKCLGFFRSVNDDHLKVITKYACERGTLCYLELRWCDTSEEERKRAKKSIEVISVFDEVGRRIE